MKQCAYIIMLLLLSFSVVAGVDYTVIGTNFNSTSQFLSQYDGIPAFYCGFNYSDSFTVNGFTINHLQSYNATLRRNDVVLNQSPRWMFPRIQLTFDYDNSTGFQDTTINNRSSHFSIITPANAPDNWTNIVAKGQAINFNATVGAAGQAYNSNDLINFGNFTLNFFYRPRGNLTIQDFYAAYPSLEIYFAAKNILVVAVGGGQTLTLIDPGGLSQNTTHFISVVIEQAANTSLKIYINGTLNNQRTVVNPVIGQSQTINSYALSNGRMSGVVDEVTVYNEALTITEINDLFNSYLYNNKYENVLSVLNPINGTYTCNITYMSYSWSNVTWYQGDQLVIPDVYVNISVNKSGVPLWTWWYNLSRINSSYQIVPYFNRSGNVSTWVIYNASNGWYWVNLSSHNQSSRSTNTTYYLTGYFLNLSLTFATLINFSLWDEVSSQGFDYARLNYSRVWIDTNETYINFTAWGRSWFQLYSDAFTRLRFELGYTNGDVIARYIHRELIDLNQTVIKICANPDPTQHFQQLFTSASSRPVIAQNRFSKCYIAADYTTYVYTGAFILNAYTIATAYDIYTESTTNSSLYYLGGLDGSIANSHNIDQLSFSTIVNLKIKGSGLSFRADPKQHRVNITYKNELNDNTAATVTIYHNSTVLETASLGSPNYEVIEFDYSGYPYITNTTVLKVSVTYTNGDTSDSLTRYFTISGTSGFLNNAIVFVVSLLLMVFGISFVVARVAFSWFGIFINIAAMAFISFGVGAWYLNFLLVMEVITLIYIFMVMWIKNSSEVA